MHTDGNAISANGAALAVEYRLTALPKTWILDLDGTLMKHNGYRTEEGDTLLEGIGAFLEQIEPEDLVVVLTSRKESERESTIRFLKENQIRYDHLIFEAPYGERIIVNDRKPSGREMAVAVNTDRDQACSAVFIRDEAL